MCAWFHYSILKTSFYPERKESAHSSLIDIDVSLYDNDITGVKFISDFHLSFSCGLNMGI